MVESTESRITEWSAIIQSHRVVMSVVLPLLLHVEVKNEIASDGKHAEEDAKENKIEVIESDKPRRQVAFHGRLEEIRK